MSTMTAGPSTVELKSVHGREPFRWGRPYLDHQGGSGTGPTLDDELRLVAAVRRSAREWGGPLPSIDVTDALLDERRGLAELACGWPIRSHTTRVVGRA
jgi:hypothetical protein